MKQGVTAAARYRRHGAEYIRLNDPPHRSGALPVLKKSPVHHNGAKADSVNEIYVHH